MVVEVFVEQDVPRIVGRGVVVDLIAKVGLAVLVLDVGDARIA